MSLRNQPYFPLYIQDYLTDEKLNLCSWSTQGIYIKILCVLHKQNEYGAILFKQTPKQNESMTFYFASILIKLFPCQMDEMLSALTELLDNGVLVIEEDKLYQKRMVKDGKTSEARSKAAKKGGGNPNLFKQTPKQKVKQTVKQNTEYENEYENEYSLLNSELKKEEIINKKETVKEFYSRELAKSNNDAGYKRLIDIIYGDNDAKMVLSGVLKMEHQINFEQFKKLLAKAQSKNIKISDKIMSFENGRYYKNRKNLYQCLNDWINKA